MDRAFDVLVVGGGLAGLAAAAYLGGAGQKVALLEQSHRLGGRAHSESKSGFQLNLGPRALYLGGAGKRILDELGVPFSGGRPVGTNFAYAFDKGTLHKFPSSFSSILRTDLLPFRAKLDLLRIFLRLKSLETRKLEGTLSDWIGKNLRRPESQRFLAAVCRIATYADFPHEQSAAAALTQLKVSATDGVIYLDGGWQTLVDGLVARAIAAGVQILPGQRVHRLELDSCVRGVRAERGFYSATSIVLAVSPAAALAIAGDVAPADLRQKMAAVIPVRAATLELGLCKLPKPKLRLAFGVDRPLYFSVHSAYAKLAPSGSALVHVAKYLGDKKSDPKSTRAELEEFVDLVQPGWRSEVVVERFLPELTVSNALVTRAGRPEFRVAGMQGLYICGDWVGPTGMLADAALSSAHSAAEAILHSRTVVETLEAMALVGAG